MQNRVRCVLGNIFSFITDGESYPPGQVLEQPLDLTLVSLDENGTPGVLESLLLRYTLSRIISTQAAQSHRNNKRENYHLIAVEDDRSLNLP